MSSDGSTYVGHMILKKTIDGARQDDCAILGMYDSNVWNHMNIQKTLKNSLKHMRPGVYIIISWDKKNTCILSCTLHAYLNPYFCLENIWREMWFLSSSLLRMSMHNMIIYIDTCRLSIVRTSLKMYCKWIWLKKNANYSASNL